MTQVQQSSSHDGVADIATMFDELAHELSGCGTKDSFEAVATVGVRRVTGASAASITTLTRGRFQTVAATDERAQRADAIQYEVGSGPCVSAIADEPMYRPGDLREEQRWGEFAQRASAELGWTSMLSFRLFQESGPADLAASLNFYAEQPRAFDSAATLTGLLLATHGALAISTSIHQDQVEHLHRALDNSREIGVAIGVLMTRHRVTRDQAFALLRVTSQHLNRKLHAIARDVADTGELPKLPSRRT